MCPPSGVYDILNTAFMASIKCSRAVCHKCVGPFNPERLLFPLLYEVFFQMSEQCKPVYGDWQLLFCTESGLLIEVGIFTPSDVAFLSSLWTKWAEIWYTFNLT